MARDPAKREERQQRRAVWRELADPEGYFVVLALTLALIVVSPLLSDVSWGPTVAGLLNVVVVVAALRASHVGTLTRRIVWAAVAVSLVGLVVVSVIDASRGPTDAAVAFGSALGAVLYLLVIPSILRHTLTQRSVTLGAVAGVLTAYFMVGLFFASVFRGVDAATGSFFAQTDVVSSDWIYFSFITLATVGYGDLSPSGQLPQTLAMLEGVLGQVFLVTVVARFVSLLGSQRDRPLAHEVDKRTAAKRTGGDQTDEGDTEEPPHAPGPAPEGGP